MIVSALRTIWNFNEYDADAKIFCNCLSDMLYYKVNMQESGILSMEQKLRRLPVMIGTLALSVVAFFLRRSQLNNAFDEIGVIAGKGHGMIWFTAVAVVLFAVFAWFLRGRKKYSSISSRWTPLFVGSCVAAALLAVGSILRLRGNGTTGIVIALGGIITAVCWVLTALGRYQARRAHGALFLLPAVFYVVDLVMQFRLWTKDPVILDYCYDLFALICTMCAVLQLGGYCFDKGSRRITVFFTMCGIFFSAAAMAGASAPYVLSDLAAALWLLVNLWLLLRPGKTETN